MPAPEVPFRCTRTPAQADGQPENNASVPICWSSNADGSTKFSYRGNSASTFASLCGEADGLPPGYLQHTPSLLLPPRHNRHGFELPDHTLVCQKLLMRILFKQRCCSSSLSVNPVLSIRPIPHCNYHSEH